MDLRKIVCIFAFGENRCVAAVETGGKRHATGVSLLIVRISSVPKRKTARRAVFLFGGLEEIRTPDPHNANVVRSQLRYKPITAFEIISMFLRFVKSRPNSFAASAIQD